MGRKVRPPPPDLCCLVLSKHTAGIYPSLADKFALLLGIPCIRLDYHRPARNAYCTRTCSPSSTTYLERHFATSRFVVVGWSFGGSLCFTVTAREPKRIVDHSDSCFLDSRYQRDGGAQSPSAGVASWDWRHDALAPMLAESISSLGRRPKGFSHVPSVRG